MKNGIKRESGFSLMEALFAVAILALGLVFVATQFPVGMIVSRDMVDQTRTVIETNNSQTMMELELANTGMLLPIRENSGVVTDYRVYLPLDNRPNRYDRSNYDINKVHMLVKPNILVTPPSPVILDGVADISGAIFNNQPWQSDPRNLAYYLQFIFTRIQAYPPDFDLEPRWPFWSHDPDSGVPFQVVSDIFLGDIGHTMSPPVDESDSEVQDLIHEWNPGYDPLNPVHRRDYLHPAILDVATKRRYSWAAFYREGTEGTNEYYRRIPEISAPPSKIGTIPRYDEYFQAEGEEFYIFTLQNPQKDVRYAVQTPDSYVIDQSGPGACYGYNGGRNNIRSWPFTDFDGSGWSADPLGAMGPVGPGDISLDRKFPVPWRVCLMEYSVRFRIDTTQNTAPTIRPYMYYGTNWLENNCREFFVPGAIAAILLEGSVLIDADPHDSDDDGVGRQTTLGSGHMYEVQDVQQTDVNEYRVRLRTPLVDDLHYFWVFPPPIIRNPDGSYDFEDWQPVVKVTQRAADIPRLER